jgi:hypothetical protein
MEKTQSNDDAKVDKELESATNSLSVFDFPTAHHPPGSGPSFYNYLDVYPELGIFLEKDNFADVVAGRYTSSLYCSISFIPAPHQIFVHNP